MKKVLHAASWVIGLTLAAATGTSQAQGYPDRPVRLMVPLAAGSTADILCRIVGEELGKRLGQPVVVENKTGAGGTIAMAELARSAPDGYTIAFGSQGTLVFNQSLYSKPGYDTVKDFAPIVLIGGVSNVMIVPPDSPIKTPPEAVAAAKARPGEMSYSSGGSGTSHHLSGVLFSHLTGTKLLHVPYRGSPQGVLAVMSGEVNMGFFNTPTVISQIRGGKAKGLAVTSLARSPLLPELPTMQEAGIADYEMNTWFGFIAPAGTPPAMVERLNKEISAVVATPAVRAKLEEQGFDLVPAQPPAALAELIASDLKKWPSIIKAAGAKVD
jgi:tripartite-type tricarboxylate transporter receptor subunit TctC